MSGAKQLRPRLTGRRDRASSYSAALAASACAPASPFVRVEKGADGLATLTLCREPVNSMNLDVWEQLGAALDELEKDRSVRGVVISSGLKKDIFTAGNDITELYSKATTEERYTRFWHAQTRCLARLLASPLVTVAAVRGHCPAGGCVLALCCDARVMTDDGRMGLNEVALGIPVPLYWGRLMASLVGAGRADVLLQTAALVPAAQALQLGLVDAVTTRDALMPAAVAEARRRLAFPDNGRIATKRMLRGPMSDAWLAYAAEEAAGGWKGLSSPAVTAALGGVLARLSKAAGPPAKL